MPEPAITPKARKRTRRNFAKELENLQAYCKVSVELLSELNEPLSDHVKGQVAAFKKILAKMDGHS